MTALCAGEDTSANILPAQADVAEQENEAEIASEPALAILSPGSTSTCLWGALQQVGRLGALDILLPVEVAGRVSAAPGIACLAPVPRQQLSFSKEAPNQETTGLNADPEGAASSSSFAAEKRNRKKSKHAPDRQPHGSLHATKEDTGEEVYSKSQSGQIILSLEEAFFLVYALKALTVSLTPTDVSALTCEVLPIAEFFTGQSPIPCV